MKRTTVTAMIALATFTTVAPAAFATDGAALFKQKCAVCHGQDGSGNTPVAKKNNIRDLRSAEVQKMTDAELTAMIAEGGKAKKATHAYKSKGMTDADIKAVVGYIRSIAKK